MKYSFLLLQVFVLQACAASSTCGDTGSQHEMMVCANKNLETLEIELRRKHEALSQALEDSHLEQAIIAWETYRDAHCASTSNIYAGGSLQAYVMAECKKTLTRRRLDSLDEDYQDTINIITQGSP